MSYIQVIVDETPRPGRFILTGSQNLLLMKSVSQTLAGRTALMRLLPFSFREMLGMTPFDLAKGVPSGSPVAPGARRWDTLFSGSRRFQLKGFNVLPWFLN